jgi:hypothetical protein
VLSVYLAQKVIRKVPLLHVIVSQSFSTCESPSRPENSYSDENDALFVFDTQITIFETKNFFYVIEQKLTVFYEI